MTNWGVMIARGNLHLTKKAVSTFLAQDIGDTALFFIDNDSPDGTSQWLRSIPDERMYRVTFKRQKSVSECWNYALQWIFSQNGEYALVLNNDVELRPETYRLLVEDGGDFVTAVGVNAREQMTEAVLEPQKRRNHPDFSAYLIRKKVFDQVQFDEAYKGGYVEDAQFHLDMFRAGIPAYCIGVPFYHVASGTMKSATPSEQKRIAEQAEKNRELFYKRHGARVGTPEYYALFENGMIPA